MQQIEDSSDYDAVYFTLDIDVLDPLSHRAPFTPNRRTDQQGELIEITKFLLSELPITAMDVVEVSPAAGFGEQHYIPGLRLRSFTRSLVNFSKNK